MSLVETDDAMKAGFKWGPGSLEMWDDDRVGATVVSARSSNLIDSIALGREISDVMVRAGGLRSNRAGA